MRFSTLPTTRKLKDIATAKDFASEKWNEKVNSLWPWKKEDLDKLKEKVDFTSFYAKSGSNASPYGSPVATKLVLQMHVTFQSLSELARTDQIPIEEGMKFAETYRKTIHRLTEEVCQQANSSEEAFYADSLIVADTLWGLVEFLLIRPLDRSAVADLLEWANVTFNQARELLSEIELHASTDTRVEEKDYFWSTIISLILVGQFRSASNVIKLSSDFRRNYKYQKIVSLLELFDYKSLHFDSAAVAFKNAQKQVKKNMESFAEDEALYFVCKLLLGDIGTFKRAAQTLSKQWYELLPAYIIFSQPTADYNDFGPLSSELYNAVGHGAPRAHEHMNSIILSLMKMDWIQALSDLASVSSLLWLSVHLFDLILRVEGSAISEEIEGIRDSVFVTYSKELFCTTSNPKLIPCAVTYAFATKEFKHDYVEPFLILIAENDGLSNAELTKTLLSICKEYGFYEALHQITIALACKALREKDWSLALHYALQNESIDIMDTVSYFVLLNAPPASIKTLNVFDVADEKISDSDAMKFLYHFHQFNISLESHDIPKCTSLLHDLIVSNLAPPEFVHVLFDNVAEIIDATNKCLDKEPLLNAEAISKLQRAVVLYQKQEEVRLQGSRQHYELSEKIDKKVTFLHLVLNNALALTAFK